MRGKREFSMLSGLDIDHHYPAKSIYGKEMGKEKGRIDTTCKASLDRKMTGKK